MCQSKNSDVTSGSPQDTLPKYEVSKFCAFSCLVWHLSTMCSPVAVTTLFHDQDKTNTSSCADGIAPPPEKMGFDGGAEGELHANTHPSNSVG